MQKVSQGPNWTDNADKSEKAENIQGTYYLLDDNVMNEMREGMAERVGFEPTLELPLNTLSKRAPSATRPSLQMLLWQTAAAKVCCDGCLRRRSS